MYIVLLLSLGGKDLEVGQVYRLRNPQRVSQNLRSEESQCYFSQYERTRSRGSNQKKCHIRKGATVSESHPRLIHVSRNYCHLRCSFLKNSFIFIMIRRAIVLLNRGYSTKNQIAQVLEKASSKDSPNRMVQNPLYLGPNWDMKTFHSELSMKKKEISIIVLVGIGVGYFLGAEFALLPAFYVAFKIYELSKYMKTLRTSIKSISLIDVMSEII